MGDPAGTRLWDPFQPRPLQSAPTSATPSSSPPSSTSPSVADLEWLADVAVAAHRWDDTAHLLDKAAQAHARSRFHPGAVYALAWGRARRTQLVSLDMAAIRSQARHLKRLRASVARAGDGTGDGTPCSCGDARHCCSVAALRDINYHAMSLRLEADRRAEQLVARVRRAAESGLDGEASDDDCGGEAHISARLRVPGMLEAARAYRDAAACHADAIAAATNAAEAVVAAEVGADDAGDSDARALEAAARSIAAAPQPKPRPTSVQGSTPLWRRVVRRVRWACTSATSFAVAIVPSVLADNTRVAAALPSLVSQLRRQLAAAPCAARNAGWLDDADAFVDSVGAVTPEAVTGAAAGLACLVWPATAWLGSRVRDTLTGSRAKLQLPAGAVATLWAATTLVLGALAVRRMALPPAARPPSVAVPPTRGQHTRAERTAAPAVDPLRTLLSTVVWPSRALADAVRFSTKAALLSLPHAPTGARAPLNAAMWPTRPLYYSALEPARTMAGAGAGAAAAAAASHLGPHVHLSAKSGPTNVVVLCFLIVDSLPYERMWRQWLGDIDPEAVKHRHHSRDKRFHVLVNAKHPDKVTSPWVRRHLLPGGCVPGGWGDICRPMLASLQQAVAVPNACHAVFVSESCLPVRPAESVWRSLTADTRSWVLAHRHALWGHLETVDARVVPHEVVHKTETWMALAIAHAREVLGLCQRFAARGAVPPVVLPGKAGGVPAHVVSPLGAGASRDGRVPSRLDMGFADSVFVAAFDASWCSEELLFGTAMRLLGLLRPECVRAARTTFTDWRLGGPHPRVYATADDLWLATAAARDEGTLFLRKVKLGADAVGECVSAVASAEEQNWEARGDGNDGGSVYSGAVLPLTEVAQWWMDVTMAGSRALRPRSGSDPGPGPGVAAGGAPPMCEKGWHCDRTTSDEAHADARWDGYVTGACDGAGLRFSYDRARLR